MTTLAQNFSSITIGLSRDGSSSEAIKLRKLVVSAVSFLKQGRSDRAFMFNSLFAFNDRFERKSLDEPLVDSATLLLAQRFLAALPSELAAPELAVDPDGEISFDWFGRSGRNFSVSLRSDGRVAYAGAFGPEKTKYGTDRFDDQVPEEIVEAVRDLQETA